MQGKPVAEQEIGKQLLLETAAYAESSVCRRKTLLHYFGEEYTEENCGNCDNCLNPKKQVEAQELLCAVIEAIIAVKENFKADYIIDILQGKETSEVQAHLHEDLEVFGSGMGEEDKTWNAVIRQALIAGYLSKDVEHYGLLKVTGGRTQVPEETEVIQDYRGQRFRRDGRRSSGTRRWLLCSRPGSLFHVEGLAEETLEETGSTALCDLPGPVFGSNGYHLSGDIGRVAEYTGRRSWKSKTLR